MSETKAGSGAGSSSSSSSRSGGIKPSIAWLGDRAQQHVFGLLRYVPNQPGHRVNGGAPMPADALDTYNAYRRDLLAAWDAPARFGGETMGPTGALGLAISRPPTIACCGEMAVLAYQKLMAMAIDSHQTMAIALVQVSGGSHAFVLAGSDERFVRDIGRLATAPVAAGAAPAGRGTLREWQAITPAAHAAPTAGAGASAGAGAPPAPHRTVILPRLEVGVTGLLSHWGVEVYVCDPWVDDGRRATFRAADRLPGGRTKWNDFLLQVAKQAGDRVVAAALAMPDGAARLSLRVDLSVVIKRL
jgi:hypothetical protein